MKRIKLVNRIFYCIFLLGFLLFMASGFIFSTVDKVTPADKRTSVVVKPEDTRYIGDDTIEYHVKIRASAGNNNALAFVSRHQEVEVYASLSIDFECRLLYNFLVLGINCTCIYSVY